eukprot:1584274-Rhodomonas_salina.2
MSRYSQHRQALEAPESRILLTREWHRLSTHLGIPTSDHITQPHPIPLHPKRAASTRRVGTNSLHMGFPPAVSL